MDFLDTDLSQNEVFMNSAAKTLANLSLDHSFHKCFIVEP